MSLDVSPFRELPHETRYPPYPWPGYTGPRPDGIKPNLHGANVGYYMRQLLLYLTRHVEQMAVLWNQKFLALQCDNGRDHPTNEDLRNARETFWTLLSPTMLEENRYLQTLIDEITLCSRHIFFVHYWLYQYYSSPQDNQWGYSNLQRRSEYLLTLTLEALCDLRVVEHRADYVDLSTVDEHPVHMTDYLRHQIQYASGLNNMWAPTRLTAVPVDRYTSHVQVVAGYLYNADPLVNIKLKLPRHFLRLLQRFFGRAHFRVDVPMFRALLARYAMFLCHLIWYPRRYFMLERHWYNPNVIFQFPAGLRGNTITYDELTVDKLEDSDFHQCYGGPKRLANYNDHSVLSPPNDERIVRPIAYSPGRTEPSDERNPPNSNMWFNAMMQEDRWKDIETQFESQDDLWFHVM